MKKSMLIFALLFIFAEQSSAQVTIWVQAYPSATASQIENIDSTNYQDGTYAIGRGTDNTHTANIFRSYYYFNLGDIPTNATIDTVIVHYNAGGGNYSLKFTKLSTTGTDLGQNWTSIANGTTLEQGLPYAGSDFQSTSFKNAVQNALASGHLIVGALSQSETTRGSQATMLTLSLTIFYTYPAAQLTVTVRNDLNGPDGGNVGVGIYPNGATSHGSSYQVPNLYESQRLNLAAYDNQSVNGKNWFFNDTESPFFKSRWEEKVGGQVKQVWEATSSVTTSALTTQDNNATFTAYLRTNTYTTSGTMSASENWIGSTVNLSGNVAIPSGVILTIYPDVTVNLNGYSIVANGGSISVQTGASLNGGVLLQSGSSIVGIYPSIGATLSAASSGQTVIVPNGSYIVSANATVPSGVTLSIGSATLDFSSSCKLHVEGRLLVNGTTFTGSSGQWFGIEFYNGSSEGSVQYSTIENAQYGLYLDNTFLSVSHCTISNCSTGAYVSGNSSPFTWTVIQNSSSRGIRCENYGDPNVGPSNVLRSNSWGVYGDASSVPYLGSSAGYNSLYSQDYYDVYSSYSGTIYALGNWWGSYPAMPSVTVNVDYSNALSSDPNTWAGKFADFPRSPLPPLPLAKVSPSSTDSAGMKDLDQAYRLYLAGDDQQALTAFQSVAQRYPDVFAGGRALAFADRLLEKLGQDPKQNLMTTIAQSLNTKMGAVAKSLLTSHLVKEGSYKEALANAEGLLDQPQTLIAKQALYDAGNIGWYHIADKAKATGYFRTLIAQYPEDPLSVSALATLGESVGGVSPKAQQTTSAQTGGSAHLALGIYPNPFNPATTIRYSIPGDGMTSLKVFDILGREVVVLVNEVKTAGAYQVRFDASNLPSGVYLYRLESAGKGMIQKALLLTHVTQTVVFWKIELVASSVIVHRRSSTSACKYST
jgi:tetratricopeptide (TPR) repeat protein